MIRITINTPSKAIIEGTDEELKILSKKLTFKNKSIEFQYNQLKKNKWMSAKYGEQYYQDKCNELHDKIKESALRFDGNQYWVLSGLVDKVLDYFPNSIVENNVQYPEFGLVPWIKEPEYDLRPYQKQAVEKMLSNPHSHIEHGTGCGKSAIIIHLCKQTGLPTIIVTPSASIARQIYEEMALLLGKQKVGLLGDGRREIGKFFLVSVAKSLSMINDPEEIEQIKKYQSLISDEAHCDCAGTFEIFFVNLLGHCPYRWFVSATQMRGDGKDLILDGIIGKRVHTYTIQKAMEEGYLAKLNFVVFDVESFAGYSKDNNIKANQEHIYKNKTIIQTIAEITNEAVLNQNKPVLILIDEYSQEKSLKPFLKCNYVFASGQADNTDLVKKFNNGEVDCIIGTSAISTGTNLLRNKITINWTGNSSEIKARQGQIGRSTRIHKPSGKDSCVIVDFRIINVPKLKRHADIRISYYNDINTVNVRKI